MTESAELYTEILPGIYRVSLSDTTIEQGVSRIEIYIVKGTPDVHQGRSLMIDTGFKQEACLEKLQSALDMLDISANQLDIFLTHRHHDHSGLAGIFAKEGAHLYMNPAEERHPYDCLAYRVSEESLKAQKTVLQSVGITPTMTPFAWRTFMKVSERVQQHGEWVLAIMGFPYTPVKPGDEFSYGSYHFTAYPLKGHTYGQMGLMEKEKKLLFVADQLIHGVSPIVATTYPDEHLLQGLFDSLRDIKEHYHDWTIIPAHGELIHDVSTDVDSIVLSYLNKSTKALNFLKARAEACATQEQDTSMSRISGNPDVEEEKDGHLPQELTVHDIARDIYQMDDHPEDEASFFTYKMLITKTFSLLEYLHDLGFARRIQRNGIFYWSAMEEEHGTE